MRADNYGLGTEIAVRNHEHGVCPPCPELASFIHSEQDIGELWKEPLNDVLEAREKEKET